MSDYRQSDVNTLKRHPERASYDVEAVHAVLDAGLLAHVGYVIDGRPFVTPTIFWRDGGAIAWHAAVAGRMMAAFRGDSGAEVCVTVSHLDALVLARSAFHHSANYRSVMAFGTARLVTDPEDKQRHFALLTNKIADGRWDEVRQPTPSEVKQTAVARLVLDEVVVKQRDGDPVDAEADHALDVWAGVVPMERQWGDPIPDPALRAGIAEPPNLRTAPPH